MSEKSDTLEVQVSEVSGRIALWRSLMDHPAWPEFKRMLEELSYTRQVVVCTTPLSNEMNIYAQEFLKGEFSGIDTALKLPQTQLDEANREIALLNKELENELEAEARERPYESRVDTREHFGGGSE